MLNHESDQIKVVEAYEDYEPPFDASSVVRELLNSVPGKYLRGLRCVVLTNETALSRRDRKGKVWSRRRKVDKCRILGRYHNGTHPNDRSAYIELRVDKIVVKVDRAPLWFPIPRDLVFGYVLFHEVGHHIHNTTQPEYGSLTLYAVRIGAGGTTISIRPVATS